MGTVYQMQEDGSKARNRCDMMIFVYSCVRFPRGFRKSRNVKLRTNSSWQVIASSRRPDGSYRKPVRVREGDDEILVCRSSVWPT